MSRPANACALVTGASRGIGAAIARALAEDGWPVAINYRTDQAAAERVEQAILAAGGDALTVRGDITDVASAPGLLDAASRLGPVLCLVNNAGIRADNLALSLGESEWSEVIETNLSAAFRLTRLALRTMVRARYGRIINVASIVGPRANAGQSNYAAAKAGLIAMSNTIAVEVARRGVTVNTLAPGLIETDMTAGLGPSLLDAVPAQRAGQPEEVAACAAFLASENAAYVNASTLYVDGGLAA
ncbi:MAG TPA: SDR family NAD(P)-dependent oxidoreductase [Solirubrobacteraceae bacterium]|nr:SDR family NAD(P)-dependent oxidoreductase [Solirubrobacteraceae bacterium]